MKTIEEEMEEHRLVGHKLKIEEPEELALTGEIHYKKVNHPKLTIPKFR